MGALYRFDISSLIEGYGIKNFVETGTLHGDAVELVDSLGLVDEIHSIELLDKLHKECVDRFEGRDHIKIHKGLSVEVLEEILPKIEGNTLFWLDAHFPGADIGEESYIQPDKEDREVIPLESELEVISRLRGGKYNDVIIADDLWLYEDGEYLCPAVTLDNHMKLYSKGETKEEIGKPNANFLEDLFDGTHEITRSNMDQGYVVMTPR